MDSNSVIQKDDPLVREYGNEYIKKIEYLQMVINDYITGQEQFNVLNFEAGLGKSYYANLIIADKIENDWEDRRNYLIVKKFNDESEKSVKAIQSGWFKDIAVAITAESWKVWKQKLDELKKFRVIIISHQRYIDLCLDDEMREVFIDGRHTLIIDEKINFPIYTYNDYLYSKVRAILPPPLRPKYDVVCKNLNKTLSKIKEDGEIKKCIRVKPQIKKEVLDEFFELLQINLDNHNIKDEKDRALVRYFAEGLRLWYSSYCVANAGNISTFNPKHKHWGLQNNIILDASAAIDGVYETNPDRFRIIKQSRIIDHSECDFIHINYNSAKSKIKENSSQYFSEMAKRIVQNHSENEKTLIVVHKDGAELMFKELRKLVGTENVWMDKMDKQNDLDYNGQPFAISWYGNLIGKNDFNDFNNVWLISTPNIPLEHYLIHYMQYSQKTLGNKSLDVVRGRFKNADFKRVQIGYIAAEMYQCLKRIQRHPRPKGKFFIVNNDKEVIDLVLSQMKGAKITQVIEELNFVKNEKEKKKKERKPDQVERFIAYVKDLPRGTKISKEEIRKTLKISNLGKVLSDSRVMNLYPAHAGIIKNHHHYIERL